MLRDATLRDGLFFSQRLIFFATFFFLFLFLERLNPIWVQIRRFRRAGVVPNGALRQVVAILARFLG